MFPLFCDDASPTFFNIFDFTIAPPLLYYAYIPILILTFLLAGTALHYNRFDRTSRHLAGLAGALGVFVIITFLQWIAAPISLVMFSWYLWSLAFAYLFLSVFLFVYVYVLDRPLNPILYSLLLILLLPIILLTPTTLNIESFDLTWCEGVLSPYLINYTYAYCVLLLGLIFGVGIYAHVKRVGAMTLQQSWVVVLSSLAFLLLFFATTYIGDLTGHYEVEVVGPLGAMIFLIGVSYVAINYKKFHINLIGSQLLVIFLITIIGSMVFINSIAYVRYVSIGSVVLVGIVGWLLSRSIKKEHDQKVHIEMLAQKLEKANKRLKVLDQLKSEFVSIASHQLRSPLTSVRGYASMLLEGSYGNLTDKAKDAVERIAESSRMMALSVEDYLNVSRIQAGNMKYVYSDFNLADMASHIVDDIRRDAVKKGLVLSFKSEMHKTGVVHADNGKTMQILHNLINNSIKYTPKGTVTVFAHDKGKKVFIDIIDTGIGMSPETITNIFAKFERAKNANEVNVTGTGLGLYVAQKMAQEMGGDIEAFSDGEGKGSTFRLTLPLQM